MLAAGCIGLIGLSAPALGGPKPKAIEQHQRVQAANLGSKNKIIQRVIKAHAAAKRAREARAERLVSMPIAETPKRPLLGWPALVTEARKYLGTNPTARSRLWCATFMNMVLAKVGYSGTNSDAAKSFAQYGYRVSEPEVGAIAVLTRGKTGGHVGVVSGIDEQGNPIIISGNHGDRVGEAIYPRSRVIAYVMPSGDRSAVTTQVAARSQTGERSQASERRASSDGGIDSPITELIAAIEAEQKRDERPVRGTTQSRRADLEPRPMQRAGTLPMDPALAGLLGITQQTRARAQAAALAAPPAALAVRQSAPVPPTPPPLRQRQIQQQADVGAASRVVSNGPVGGYGLR
jgi:uncharacterized protein (TIGR02594 family)